MIYFYLLFINKIILKYHYVAQIYNMINKMIKENYVDLGNFNKDKVIIFSFIRTLEENYEEPKNEKEAISDVEKNIYVFRIIFMIYFYLLFINKIILKYHYVAQIYNMINKMIKENYVNLGNFNKDKVIIFIDDIINIISRIRIKIKGEIKEYKKIFIDEGLSFYINFVNLSILKELSSFIDKNEKLKKIKNSELIQMAFKKLNKNSDAKEANKIARDKSDHYFYEEFKFMSYLKSLIHSYLDNFDINIEKYISFYMKCDLRYAIHEELKKIYIKKSPIKFAKKEKNFKIIKYEYLFSSKSEEKFNERFNNFEKLFNLREIICKYITYLSKKFKYEKKQGDEPAENTNTADPSLPPSNYTLSSINIVSSLFHKVGYEVFNLNENLIINDFCCNNCDMTQMAVSFGHQGNIKINFLNNLISKKKTDSLLTLMEKDELDNWEQSYKNSYVNDYFTFL